MMKEVRNQFQCQSKRVTEVKSLSRLLNYIPAQLTNRYDRHFPCISKTAYQNLTSAIGMYLCLLVVLIG